MRKIFRTVGGVRLCSICNQWLPLNMFYWLNEKKGLKQARCKPCHKIYMADWYQRTILERRDYTKRNYLLNIENRRKYSREYRARNIERVTKYMKEYQKNNKYIFREICRRRKAAKKMAVPKWVNHFFVKEIYLLAELRTKYFGIRHEVDHIVPLQNKLVCGLHCEQNLRIIPAIVNYSKGNRHWPDMP